VTRILKITPKADMPKSVYALIDRI